MTATASPLLSAPARLSAEVCALLSVSPGLAVDEAGLTTLYRNWCQHVPFDSIRKRIFFAGGARGEVPGPTAVAFLEDLLAGGTGGTCWSTSFGLVAIARFLGFDARLAAAVMHTDPDVAANHCTVVVTLGKRQFLLDTSMLFEQPLNLDCLPEIRDDALHPLRARPGGDDEVVVWWKPGHYRSSFIGCTVNLRPFADDMAAACHERTRDYSLFNSQLFIRRNHDHRIDSFGRGTLISVGGTGERRTAVPAAERDQLLVEHFGISPEIVRRIPPDEPGSGWI
jgi:N-hydroxyarylamine O-acetyltransferase